VSPCHRPRRCAAPLARVSGVALCALALCDCSVVGTRPAPPATPAAVAPAPAPQVAAPPEAVPRAEPRSAHGNPPFYDVLGQRYYVLGSADGYVERGVASWYGPTFHGGSTSSGEPYDMYGMTAAHKTLPLPTWARVTNLKNGKSIVVRINDRGPFVANRLIDLSYTAAERLDMLREGTTLVEVRALSPGVPEELGRAAASPPPVLYLQAGAFADAQRAQRLLSKLQGAGLRNAFIASPLQGRSSALYRVRLGPVASVAEYDALSARLAALGIRDARLALE
jgi:rare lipoprotein A